MAWIVQTTEGVLVQKGGDGSSVRLGEKDAKASAEQRNAQAEALGVKVRYEAVER